MPDRFKDAKWYIAGGDSLSAIICDASDPDGDGPNGHGMVCRNVVKEDAALIVQAPALLRIARILIMAAECSATEDHKYETLMDEAIDSARDAVAQVEG